MSEYQRLTASRLACMRRCPRQHSYQYEMRLSRVTIAPALRMGSAFHKGLELRNEGKSLGEAAAAVDEQYYSDAAQVAGREVEAATIAALLSGYYWRYENDDFAYEAGEMEWEMPLRNPETGASSRTFVLAGKIDAMVLLADGRQAVMEYKTAGEDISTDSEYWQRLTIDPQIGLYVLAARHLRYDVQVVEYDVTRKPGIAPKTVPVLDADKAKIVLGPDGERVFNKDGSPKQSADRKKEQVLQTRIETAEEFGERLLDDIGTRPDFYFQRRELPQLEDQLAELQFELWAQGQELMARQRLGRWTRNPGFSTCGRCEYREICWQSVQVDAERPPSGFRVREEVHPELTSAA